MSAREPQFAGRTILVVGCGDTGLSMARFASRAGAGVRVIDSRAAPPCAEALRRTCPDAALATGALDTAALADVDAVAVSPGVDLRCELVSAARRRGLPVTGDIDWFAAAARAPVLAITGSNGKSTVTAWTRDVLVGAGVNAVACGNYGPPALDALAPEVEAYVLEVSSFQLELSHGLAARAAAVLNVSADHIDRHGSLARYAAAKARVFTGAETALVNADDATVAAMATGSARVRRFGSAGDADYRLVEHGARRWLAGGRDAPWLACERLRVHGRHNHINALVVWALAATFGLSRAAIEPGLTGFAGLPHRCQLVVCHRAVRWINDSKGTNLGAAAAALASIDPPILWLLGGQAKGADFAAIGELAGRRARAAVVFGQDRAAIARALAGFLPVETRATLAAAVALAGAWARAGDSVLLSPGCASFDQFEGFAARGEAFAAEVARVAA